MDRLFGRTQPPLALGLEPQPGLRQLLPVLRARKLDRAGERRPRLVRVLEDVEHPFLLAADDRPLPVDAGDRLALQEHLPDDDVVGGQLAGLLGDRLRLGEPLLIDERVVFVHHQGDPLVHLDLLGPLTLHQAVDLGGLAFQRQLGPALAGQFLDVAPGPLDPPGKLLLLVGGDRLGLDVGGRAVEERQRVPRRLLRQPLGLQLLGGHLRRHAGEENVVGNASGRCGGSGRGGRLAASRSRPARRLVDHLPCRSCVGRGARGRQFIGTDTGRGSE